MEASYTSSRTCINAYATVIITSKLKDSFVSLRMSVGWSVGWLVEPWLGRPQFNDEYVYEFHAVVGFLSTLHRAVQNGKVITTWNIKEFAIVPIERSISRSQSQSRSLCAFNHQMRCCCCCESELDDGLKCILHGWQNFLPLPHHQSSSSNSRAETKHGLGSPFILWTLDSHPLHCHNIHHSP